MIGSASESPPSELGGAARQLIYVGGSAADPVVRWVNLATAGAVTVGIGVPDWWDGVKPPC